MPRRSGRRRLAEPVLGVPDAQSCHDSHDGPAGAHLARGAAPQELELDHLAGAPARDLGEDSHELFAVARRALVAGPAGAAHAVGLAVDAHELPAAVEAVEGLHLTAARVAPLEPLAGPLFGRFVGILLVVVVGAVVVAGNGAENTSLHLEGEGVARARYGHVRLEGLFGGGPTEVGQGGQGDDRGLAGDLVGKGLFTGLLVGRGEGGRRGVGPVVEHEARVARDARVDG
ncbi:hypothetical protein PG995_015311 [Apiospora arundinis]